MVRVPVSRIYAPISIIEEEHMSEPRNLTQKLLGAHLTESDLIPGEEIDLTVDQILLEDALGSMTALQFEALGADRVTAPLAADTGATYDEDESIDISDLEPLIAKPTSPDNVVPVREVAGTETGARRNNSACGSLSAEKCGWCHWRGHGGSHLHHRCRR
jgi:homoaconitase/3-isopropylmalate dehydratase large subunit